MADKITIKSSEEIELMRESCRVTATILDEVSEIIQPAVSTEEINRFGHQRTIDMGATPSPLNYRGFPKSVCVSPNEVVCHGVPSPFVKLKAGDIVNFDVTSYKNGFHGDSSRMYFVGGKEACSDQALHLVETAFMSMWEGIAQVKPGGKVGDIGAAIKVYVDGLRRGYGIVREYTGHGLGREFHEAPQIIHIGKRGTGESFTPGMTFTIEPMINMGTWRTSLSQVDGWTVRTMDGKLSAQWEHTVLVTDKGVEVLTLGNCSFVPEKFQKMLDS